MNINININAPGLESAINALAQAISQVGRPNRVEVDSSHISNESLGAPQATITTGTIETAPEPTQPIQPDPAPVNTAPAQPEPTPAQTAPAQSAQPQITLETVRLKLAELAQAGKQQQVKALITSFGAQRISDVQPEKYPELLQKASEL